MKRFKIRTNSKCVKCGSSLDDAEHLHELDYLKGMQTPENLVDKMMKSE